MSDQVVLFVDRLGTPVAVQSVQDGGEVSGTSGGGRGVLVQAEGTSGSVVVNDDNGKRVEENEVFTDGEEDEPLLQTVECRICQEEDRIKNLETPCACSGSLKYAHRKCVQRWCDEKGDIICEICHQPYQSGYTAPPRSEDVAIDIGGWTISGTPLDLRDPRVLSMAEAERHFMEAEYDEYAASNASGAAFCRSVALILMALLLFRHALTIIDDADGDGDDDMSAFFSVSGVVSSCSCFGLLDFSCPASLWPGPSVSCNVDGKDRWLLHWQRHKLLLCYKRHNIGAFILQ